MGRIRCSAGSASLDVAALVAVGVMAAIAGPSLGVVGAWGDAFLQLDDLEAALLLLCFLGGFGGLRRLAVTRLHGGTSFRCGPWSTKSWGKSSPRPADRPPGDAGPRRHWRGGRT